MTLVLINSFRPVEIPHKGVPTFYKNYIASKGFQIPVMKFSIIRILLEYILLSVDISSSFYMAKNSCLGFPMRVLYTIFTFHM